MNLYHSFDINSAAAVEISIRCLTLAGQSDSKLAARLRHLGAEVEVEAELYTGIAALIDDPRGYDLLVIDCDSMGGLALCTRALVMLRAEGIGLAAVLISSDHLDHCFPEDRQAPIRLRAPCSALSLRVGLEHTMRDRMLCQAA